MTKTEVLKLVRAKCLECCCGSTKEVNLCVIPDCALYPIRSGKDPSPRRMSAERRATLANHLDSIRPQKKAAQE